MLRTIDHSSWQSKPKATDERYIMLTYFHLTSEDPAVPSAQNWQESVRHRYTHPLFGEVWTQVAFSEDLWTKPYLRRGNKAKRHNYAQKYTVGTGIKNGSRGSGQYLHLLSY